MVEQTFIKGKEACLEASIEKMQNRLVQAGFQIEQASWLNPVPNIYSVHIRDKICPALFTNGKGASRKATYASAMGEYFERLETNYFFSDYYLQTDAEKTLKNNQAWLYYPDEKAFSLADYRQCLTPELWRIYDANDEWQAEDLLSLNDSGEAIRCLPLVNQTTQETVYFPVAVFSNFYASNGLCAGNTVLEAAVQGLSEVFERWVKAKILKENLCLPEVPEAVLSQFPTVMASIAALREEGLDVSVRDASLGGQYPVMNVNLFEQKTGRCFASFGAHPIFEVALERTLTESLQGRKLEALDGFQTPIFDAFLVAEDENIENHFIDSSGLIHAKFISQQADFEFVHWDCDSSSVAVQWQSLLDTVHAEGFEVYMAHYNHFGLDSCRVVVPGMSEIYPFSEILDNNQNKGRLLRDQLFQLSLNDPSTVESLLDEVDALALVDHQGVANLIGMLPDAQSYWKKLKIIELKMWANLAIQDYEMAYELLQDCFYFVDDEAMRADYVALSFALEIVLNESLEAYPLSVQATLFGAERVAQVWRWINGEQGFANLTFGETLFEQSQAHQTLVSVYHRIQAIKAENHALNLA